MLELIEHPRSRSPLGTLAILAAALLGGCNEPPDVPIPTTLTVAPAEATLADIGDTVHLSATVMDQHGQVMAGVAVRWLTSDATVATVVGTGLVRARRHGTANVWAFVEGLLDTTVVTVELGVRGQLVTIYEALEGSNWNNDTNWGTGRPVDTWHGVRTDAAGNVVQLLLSGNGVAGAIPPEIGLLEHLEYLDLSSNPVGGLVPPEIGSLRNLTTLQLSATSLEGSLPPEIGNLENLRTFSLVGTTLSGPLPPEIGNLQSLTSLNFSGTGLAGGAMSGSIPPEIGNLRNLRSLDLSSNRFSGSIPPEIGGLAPLQTLNLRSNRLTGSIPPEIGSLQNLRQLELNYNELSGPLPPEIGDLSRLTNLYASHNRLTGTFPPEIGKLERLRAVWVFANPMNGRLPVELTALGLTAFHWNETDLCAPSDNAFQEWLESINDLVAGENCEDD